MDDSTRKTMTAIIGRLVELGNGLCQECDGDRCETCEMTGLNAEERRRIQGASKSDANSLLTALLALLKRGGYNVTKSGPNAYPLPLEIQEIQKGLDDAFPLPLEIQEIQKGSERQRAPQCFASLKLDGTDVIGLAGPIIEAVRNEFGRGVFEVGSSFDREAKEIDIHIIEIRNPAAT